ncbi:MAG: hypothetical protein KUG79_17255 [Pseudomonadales bacterium]|nr:hypothetical protein [Pseudomonadales bacterium]
MIKTLLFRYLITLVGKLPLPALQFLGAILGSLLWFSRSRMAMVSMENIDRSYPELSDQERQRLAKQSLQETGRTIFETTLAWTRPLNQCRQYIIAVRGKTAVDSLQTAGTGLIFIIPHLGNWELINHYLGAEYGLTHMYQPNRNPHLDTFIQACRARTGTQFVVANAAGIKAQITRLKNGGTIGIMPDQEPAIHAGQFADFFGIQALTNTLATRLCKRTGAKIVFAFCQREPAGNGFSITLTPLTRCATIKPTSPQPPAAITALTITSLASERAASEKTATAELLTKDVTATQPTAEIAFDLNQLNQGIESAIREVPAQYLWSYKRFRTRPHGELDFYQFTNHPLRTYLEIQFITTYLRLTKLLSHKIIVTLARRVNPLAMIILRRRSKINRVNLALHQPPPNQHDIDTLQRCSMQALVETAFETGKIWLSDDQRFQSMCITVEGSHNFTTKGALVFTPPLGNREIVMRYLGKNHQTLEYYHPNSLTSLDQLIRKQRNRMGIGVLNHGETGLQECRQKMAVGQVITLCPDQQPRLRGGVFVPFFGCPALTSTAMPRLIRETQATPIFAVAWREAAGFRLQFQPCTVNRHASDKDLLTQINQQLEALISQNPCQYRWSDKRYNIRPRGHPKLYR